MVDSLPNWLFPYMPTEICGRQGVHFLPGTSRCLPLALGNFPLETVPGSFRKGSYMRATRGGYGSFFPCLFSFLSCLRCVWQQYMSPVVLPWPAPAQHSQSPVVTRHMCGVSTEPASHKPLLSPSMRWSCHPDRQVLRWHEAPRNPSLLGLCCGHAHAP